MAAANTRDQVHQFAEALITSVGRDLVVLDTVATETDMLLRRRYGPHSAQLFLDSLATERFRSAPLTPGLLKRAIQIDRRYADLDLGLVDASVMAYAERHSLPILTFDHRDFRASQSIHGPWNLLVDERDLVAARRPTA